MHVDYAITLMIALVTSAGFWACVQHFMSRKSREDERDSIDREQWFDEANEAYQRVREECNECKQKVDKVNRELSEVKNALLDRINAFDEVLPYIVGLDAGKIRELRRANQAVRLAIYKGFV